MRRKPRLRIKTWLYWSAFALALIAGYTVFNARLPLGSAGTVRLARWTVRVEIGTNPTGVDGWRGHPWKARIKRRNSGTIIELGAGVLFSAAVIAGVAAFFIRPRRVPPTLCWSCWYDLKALPPGIRTCPECGAKQEDVPV